MHLYRALPGNIDTIKPALRILGKQDDTRIVAGMHIIMTKRGPIFFADTTVNLNPGWEEELVDITLLVAKAMQQFNLKPRIALLSYSNFGSSDDPNVRKVRQAVNYLHENYPSLVVDGEIQANMAFINAGKDNYPFTELVNGGANALVFPSLEAGNIAYKLMMELAGYEAIGPILLGMKNL